MVKSGKNLYSQKETGLTCNTLAPDCDIFPDRLRRGWNERKKLETNSTFIDRVHVDVPVSQISNFTVVSSRQIVCVRKAAAIVANIRVSSWILEMSAIHFKLDSFISEQEVR